MEPLEFCRQYVNLPPEARGFYTACCRELAEATGLSIRSIQNWGSDFSRRPKYVLSILHKEDVIRKIKRLVSAENLDQFSS